MLQMVIRKMIKNKWMVLCLLIGVIIATAMMSSIPQYTGGILQKVLTKDLEDYQTKNNVYPGTYYVKNDYVSLDRDKRVAAYKKNNEKIKNTFIPDLNLPLLNNVTILNYGYINMVYRSSFLNQNVSKNVELKAMSDLQEHIKITHGKYPSKTVKDGVIEIMLTESALQDYDVKLDQIYEAKDLLDDNAKPLKVKIVGVFAVKSLKDSYWYNGDVTFNNSFFVDYSLFNSEFMKKDYCELSDVEWYVAFDYHKINLKNINSITKELEYQEKWIGPTTTERFDIPALETLQKYNERQKQLKTLLWVLQMPVMLMLIFYLFMVSQLIIEEEKNEIAVLKSRGATGFQIFKSYFSESLILSVVAIIIGPILGLVICKFLGASNGFLNFVQRTSLPIYMDYNAYLYALIAIGIFIVTMLVPSYFASKTTIVIHKQNKKSKKNIPFWKKYFLDVVLIGISIYGIYSYNLRQNMMNYSTGTLTELPIDPLLFLVSTFFILGCGLLFLRIYPYIIKFVFWCGKKIWSPAAYASLLSVSRSGGRDQFLILFLIFTLSIGIFNAKAARTINTNSDEKAEYSIGADVTLLAQWKNNSVSTSVSIPGNGAAVPSASTSTSSGDLEYYEPDYYQYQHLAGVDLSTKVMVKDTASVNIDGKSSEGVNFMAIIPDEFGKIAWFRNDLLPYHWYNYLNLMTKDSRAMLLSRSMQKKYNIKLGDYITVYLGNSTSVTGMAYAFVDYWPTYNPHKDKDGKYQDMVIANFNYLEQTLPITPYEVWIKKKTNATSQALYDDIKKKDLKIQEINDTSQQVIKNRNNPILQGVNGALTLGFMVTMVITAVGFLIYWIMSIRNRILQFGILRAMGLRLSELIQMLVLEQMLISLVAILIGAVIGSVTGNIFVPMLKLAFSTSDQVPPFKVMAYTGDYIKIYVIVAAIIAIGLIVIGRFVAKIKIAQAIKLGED